MARVTLRGTMALLAGARSALARVWAARRCQQCGAATPTPAWPEGQRVTEVECPRCHVRTICFAEID